MSLTITIGGIDLTLFLALNTLDVNDTINRRSLASFKMIFTGIQTLLADENGNSVVDENGNYIELSPDAASVSEGAAVLIKNGATSIFGGTIETYEIEELAPNSARTELLFTINCVDYSELADRHLVARTYTAGGQTADSIMLDIVSKDLAGEGVTTSQVAVGPAITKILWNYRKVSAAFDDLAQIAGYSWWIDADKVLWFQHRMGVAAPLSLTDTSANFRMPRLRVSRDRYRNRQYVRAGKDTTAARTEDRHGDSKTRAFLFTYPMGAAPSVVTVNGVAKTIGVKGIDTGKDWYWTKGDPTITQDDAGTLLTATDTLTITYIGLYPLIVLAQSDSEIAARAAASGGSGYFEDIEDDPDIDGASMATDEANAMLGRYGTIPQVFTFETDTAGLVAGQILTATITNFGITGDWLIEAVTAHDYNGVLVRYTVRAVSGQAIGGWEAYFRDLAQSGRKFVFRDNEVLQLLRQIADAVTVGDSMSSVSAAPESRVGYALVGYSEVGA